MKLRRLFALIALFAAALICFTVNAEEDTDKASTPNRRKWKVKSQNKKLSSSTIHDVTEDDDL